MEKIPLAAALVIMVSLGAKAENGPVMPDGAKGALDAAAALLNGLNIGTTKSLSNAGEPAALSHSELKSLLPVELSGLRRTNVNSQKTELMGLKVAQAEGEYGEAECPHLVVKITDLGGMGALAGIARLGWAATELANEGDDGYERTINYGPDKALEKYRTKTKSGAISVMVANRFVLEIEGRNVDPAQMKSALEAIDLEALANIGRAAQPKTE